MIINKNEFCMHVEEEYSTNGMSMIDNILSACDVFKVDPDLVAPLINRSLKEKIEIEFIDLNYLEADSVSII